MCEPIDQGTKSGEDTGVYDAEDTGSGPLTCDGDFVTPGLQYDQVLTLCVTGDSPIGVPPDYQVHVPSSFGTYLAYPTWDDYDSVSDTFQMEINHATPGSPLLNDPSNDGFIWLWNHDPVCSDYDVVSVNVLVLDGYLANWAYFTPTCPVVGMPALPSPLAPPGKVASGAQSCTAGEGDFDFGVRRVLANDGSNATLWLTPVLESGDPFPERAWLREVTVTDWGDATSLHLAEDREPLDYAGLAFVGGVDIPKPTSGPTVVTYAAGDVPMSTLFGTEGIPITGNTFDLPQVHLEWSCPSGGSTHWAAVPNRSGQAATIPSTYGFDQRVVFWIADDGSNVRIAPEGRYADYLESPLVSAAGGGKTFRVYLAAYDAVVTGRLRKDGSIVDLEDVVITIGGVPTTLANQTLSPLSGS